MTHSGGTGNVRVVNEDEVLRARVLLLASWRLSVPQRVEAYRVLARVSPDAYAPKLADWLGSALFQTGATPERSEELAREAVEAARRVRADHAKRAETLLRALDLHQGVLFELGRRAEGLTLCEEMAAVGREEYARGRAVFPRASSRRLVTALMEEGRYAEAAERHGGVPSPGLGGAVEASAVLEAAGRTGEAVEAFGEHLAELRAEVTGGLTTAALLVWALLRQAEVLERAGRDEGAAGLRREAGEALARLAAEGDPRGGGTLDWWVRFFLLSGRADEPPASPKAPAPFFGQDSIDWSHDVRRAFDASAEALEAEAAELGRRAGADPVRWLPRLVTAHRRFALRAARRARNRGDGIPDALRPVFDEGVALGRRLSPAAEARALTDRASMLLAAGAYGEAHADFTAAQSLRAATAGAPAHAPSPSPSPSPEPVPVPVPAPAPVPPVAAPAPAAAG
ncbi:hypothetical protein [Streptomyces omiyaensis]|uniref:hypothetical protein n=1 Tax=Streptomyces omiyaensis TaxID=68247 RepID=UPI0036FF1E09